jgi:subtilase family serine protease
MRRTSNGATFASLSDTLLPDLRIQLIEHTPEFALPGDLITWSVTVINSGPGNLNAQWGVDLLDNASQSALQTERGEPLVVGGTEVITFIQPASADQTLLFKIDSSNEVREADEGGNSRTQSLNEVLLTDVELVSVSPVPGSPSPGQRVTWNYSIRNNGPGVARAFEIRFLTATSPTGQKSLIDTTEINSMNPGGTFDGEFVRDAMQGEFLFFEIVGGDRDETDLTNNEKVVEI